MIIKESYVVGSKYSDFSIYSNDWKLKGACYLNYISDTLGLSPIRRIK